MAAAIVSVKRNQYDVCCSRRYIKMTIDKLLQNYYILNQAKEKISEHEKEYREIIEAVKGSEKEKDLASLYIGKFCKFFPSLADAAIDASLDLCKDKNVRIRRQAIFNLYLLCEITKEHIPKIGDILAKLLVVNDSLELDQVHMSLRQILKLDSQQALNGIFSQILTGDERTRDHCFEFLLKQIGIIGSTPFIKYACEKLFPSHTWNSIGANDSDRDQQHLRVLKEYMPLPPTEVDGAIGENPSFKFSHAECLLYAIHKLGKQDVDFFKFKDDQNKLEEFRSRLQYLARGTQRYIEELQEAVKGKAPKEDNDEATTNENEIKKIALKTTSNISTLIHDLLYNPPIFCSDVQLSWITNKSNDSNKRHVPITFQPDAKRKKIGAKSITSPTSSSEQRLHNRPEDSVDGPVLPDDQQPWQNQQEPLDKVADDLRTENVGLLNLNKVLKEEIADLKTRVEGLEAKATRCTCGAMNS